MSDLIKGNRDFQEKKYVSALINYQRYSNENIEMAEILKVQDNINRCLNHLDVVSDHKPLVSIIIPTHNVEEYIERCLHSVLNQTLRNIEVILIDDGSSDNSPKIIKEIASRDSRIVTIFNSKGSGNSGTPRNQGIKYANGEYICFVDADDYIDSKMLEDLFSKALDEDADIVTSSGFIRETFGDQESEVVRFGDLSFDSEINKDRSYLLRIPQFPIIWYRIYRTSFLKKNHIFLGEYKVSADVIFSLKSLLLADKISQVDGIYYHYNFSRPGSTIERRQGEQVLDLFKSYNAITNFIKHNNLENYMGLVINKFIGDFFYCKKNLRNEFISTFDSFSSVYVKRNLNNSIERQFISSYSNQTLDKLYNDYTAEMDLLYDQFLSDSGKGPLISVIMPVYNLEKYLDKSINSIIRQKLENFELIIINDGSSDNSKNVINHFLADKRVIFIDVNRSSGTPATPRNLGLIKARGDYIAFVDGDDWIEGEFLSRLHASANSNKSDVIYARAFFREEEGVSKKFILNSPVIGPTEVNETIRQGLIKAPFFSNIWNRLYKRDFLKRYSIFFPKMYVSEDLAFSLICTSLLSSANLGDTQGYHYRYNRPNSTTELRTGVAALRQIYSHKEFLNYLQDYKLSECMQLFALAKKANSYCYTWNRINDEALREFFKMQVIDLLKDTNFSKDVFSGSDYDNYRNMMDLN